MQLLARKRLRLLRLYLCRLHSINHQCSHREAIRLQQLTKNCWVSREHLKFWMQFLYWSSGYDQAKSNPLHTYIKKVQFFLRDTNTSGEEKCVSRVVRYVLSWVFVASHYVGCVIPVSLEQCTGLRLSSRSSILFELSQAGQ